jgi:hypothetical protein
MHPAGYSKWVVEAHMLQGIMHQYADALRDQFGSEAAIQVLTWCMHLHGMYSGAPLQNCPATAGTP